MDVEKSLETNKPVKWGNYPGKVILLSSLGGFYFLLVHLFTGTDLSWPLFFQAWIFSLSVIGISIGLSLIRSKFNRWKLVYLILGLIFFTAWFFYFFTSNTALAWILLSLSCAVFLHIDDLLTRSHGNFRNFIVHGFLAIGFGFGMIALVQIDSQFAEEEFFSLVQAAIITGYWIILLIVEQFLKQAEKTESSIASFSTRPLFIGVLIFLAIGSLVTIFAYQRSFYPQSAPAYPGIDPINPFICGELEPDDQVYSGEEVYEEILNTLESSQKKSSPDLAFLALGTGDNYWAERYRESILLESRDGNYTKPAGSVKYGQYLATFRAYFYSKMLERFPDLFSPSEQRELDDWFAAINRRALTVELIDLMYALAFSKLPDGPYENQETGSGLLALLETQDLADPASSPENRSYLDKNLNGWSQRFSNTDDAAVYQPEWINNAYYQSLYSGEQVRDNVRLSFEWLLLQALPDGAPLRYNHVGSANFGGLGYLGASLLGDERFIWLAGRALEYLNSNERPLAAQPGIEGPLDMEGHSPSQGSCLLFGDSGLPNQVGPLAPDKLVFRDGWARNSTYLLENLRFTGWHRYKATNTITMIYENGILAADQLSGEVFGWLPEGRSLFRDKRIPRENLNGILVEKVGLSEVLHDLTGLGSPWAQDPPHYARVKEFTTKNKLDTSTTVLEDWYGWTHERTIFFHHDGPIVIKDDARGPQKRDAAISWNLVSEGQMIDDRLVLRSGQNPAEVLFLGNEHGDFLFTDIQSNRDELPNLQVQYTSEEEGQLSLVSIFLTGDWVGAQAEITRNEEGTLLEIWTEDERISMLL